MTLWVDSDFGDDDLNYIRSEKYALHFQDAMHVEIDEAEASYHGALPVTGADVMDLAENGSWAVDPHGDHGFHIYESAASEKTTLLNDESELELPEKLEADGPLWKAQSDQGLRQAMIVEEIATAVRRFLDYWYMTATEFSELAGVDRDTVHKLFKGWSGRLRPGTLLKLKAAMSDY